ncbi:hypothetical protein WME90_33590 [Sorangium sp. So ce375]|uniref:hypothetical protein n=1 Tax=Sorangium sp. So ce375 TaxID=3133306 RepID=UPI003F5C2CCA
MKLVKALGVLALSGMALGASQIAAAEGTTPIQELVLVEETTSLESPDARIPPDDVPYHGYFRPFQPSRPYGDIRPFMPFWPYRPYGHFRPFRPFRPYGSFHPYGLPLDHGRSEAAPAGDQPGPVMSLGEPR